MTRDTYIVWCPDDGGTEATGVKIGAYDAELAALKWAEIDDSKGDWNIASGGGKWVNVKNIATDEVTYWAVSGEYTAEYHAKREDAK